MRQPSITTFPSADVAFAAFVRRCLADAETPSELEAALRAWYVDATVHARDELAGFGLDELWYAYRDGAARQESGGEWWSVPAVARMEFGREGIFLAATAAAEDLAGGPLVGRPLADVRPDDIKDDPQWLWQAIEEHGAVISTARLRRLDGTERLIEFRAARGESPGRYVSWWRPLA